MRSLIELVRNSERAVGLRKQIATSEEADVYELSLGSTVKTPNAFLEEAWSLFGDGRVLVSNAARTMYMMSALQVFARELCNDFALSDTLGTAKLLGNFVERYSGTAEFDETVLGVADITEGATEKTPDDFSIFSKSQLQVLQVLAEYFFIIDKAGLIEPGCASTQLENSGNLPNINALGSLKISEELFAGPPLTNLFNALGANYPAKAIIAAPEKDVIVNFKFAAGTTVLKQIVYNEINAALEGASKHVVVFAANPVSMYNSLAPYLCKNDVRAALKTRIPVNETNIGKALHSMHGLVSTAKEGANWRTFATDFAYSKLSNIAPLEAQNFNTEIRRDSLMTREQGFARLKEISSTAAAFETFTKNPCHANLESLHLDKDEIAANGLSSLVTTYESCDISSPDTFFEIWESLAVDFSQSVSPEESSTINNKTQSSEIIKDVCALVEFRSTGAFDAFAPSSVDAVIFADLTKDVISISAARPATDSLLTLMKIADTRDLYQEKHAAFASAVAAARKFISCVMPMRNSAGAQLYPSFLYDEFVQIISDGDTKPVDDEKVFVVPSVCDTKNCITDESDLEAGFGEVLTAPTSALSLNQPVRGILKNHDMNDFMSHYEGLPILSPSQIETYAKCPYNWFVSRKLRLNDIDEKLDNLRLGSFAHKVFERTFETLAQIGVSQITDGNIEETKTLATELFDQILTEQVALDPQSESRCVRADEHDVANLRILKNQILATLENMILLPPDFSVWNHEVKIGPEYNRLVQYANSSVYLNGSVDRVDINRSSSRYIIYDYKGSIAGHDSGHDDEEALQELPEKIQTLIYAQAIGRLGDELGLGTIACVGAMYLGYKKAQDGLQLAGSADSEFSDLSSLAKKSSIVQTGTKATKDFQDFLNTVESLIEIEVSKMKQGDISPIPKTPKACEFCDVVFCEMRKVAEGYE